MTKSQTSKAIEEMSNLLLAQPIQEPQIIQQVETQTVTATREIPINVAQKDLEIAQLKVNISELQTQLSQEQQERKKAIDELGKLNKIIDEFIAVYSEKLTCNPTMGGVTSAFDSFLQTYDSLKEQVEKLQKNNQAILDAKKAQISDLDRRFNDLIADTNQKINNLNVEIQTIKKDQDQMQQAQKIKSKKLFGIFNI